MINVWHVGTTAPALIQADSFLIENDGHLTLREGQQVVARFAPTKWSAAIKSHASA
jgi:hypothetical protein